MTAINPSQSLIKSGAVGGEQESGFEQAFSSLAYAYLKDKAPRLIDYIVGFQLVDRNNDNTKAVGVFGFKVGSQWLYAPVFFLNGDLKGHELLYTKSQDAFVPMKENWVNYLMSRKPHVLGEGSPQETQQLGGLSASLTQFTFPPNFNKVGRDTWDAVVKQGFDRGVQHVDEWAKPAVSMIASGILKKARFLFGTLDRDQQFNMQKVAENPSAVTVAGTALSLEDFLSEDLDILKAAYDLFDSNPAINDGITRFHGGREMFARIGQAMRDKVAAADNSIMPTLIPARKVVKKAEESCGDTILPVQKYESETHKVDPTKKVEVWTQKKAMSPRGFARLSTEQRTKIAQHGYLVEDERSGDEVSVAYKTQVANALTNPGETDIYSMLERPGKFAKMLVPTAGRSSTHTRLRSGSTRKATSTRKTTSSRGLRTFPVPACPRAACSSP
jgi:hypothetical protein